MTVSPSDVAFMDPIGDGCVDGGGYDDPFPAAKGVRAPAFCLPDPCAGALSREELGFEIVGREVRDWEWDAYYSRYAETCRAETFLPSSEPRPRTPEEFWEPILRPPGAVDPATLAAVIGPAANTGAGIGGFPADTGTDPGRIIAGRTDPPAPSRRSTDIETKEPPPAVPRDAPADLTVVPIPLAGWLLLSALAGLAAWRRFA